MAGGVRRRRDARPPPSPEITVTGLRYASTVTLTGPARLVDETPATWPALDRADGSPVNGA